MRYTRSRRLPDTARYVSLLSGVANRDSPTLHEFMCRPAEQEIIGVLGPPSV